MSCLVRSTCYGELRRLASTQSVVEYDEETHRGMSVYWIVAMRRSAAGGVVRTCKFKSISPCMGICWSRRRYICEHWVHELQQFWSELEVQDELQEGLLWRVREVHVVLDFKYFALVVVGLGQGVHARIWVGLAPKTVCVCGQRIHISPMCVAG